MERNQRRAQGRSQRLQLSQSRFYKLIQLRGLVKLQKLSNRSKRKLGYGLNFCMVMMFLIFGILHLAHVSSFYTIKTYMDTIDIYKIRENFSNMSNNSTEDILIAERDPLKGWWNSQIKGVYEKYFAASDDVNEVVVDQYHLYLKLQSNDIQIQDYLEVRQKEEFKLTLPQMALYQFVLQQEYFCIQNQGKFQLQVPCSDIKNSSQNYYQFSQNLTKDHYPNTLSYGITQIGVLMSNEIFYTNLMYEILAPVKRSVKTISLLSFLDYLHDSHYSYLIDLSAYPEPPDSIATYVAEIKFFIVLKTVLIMMAIGGFVDFIVQYIKKVVYLMQYRVDKLLSFKQILKFVGMTGFFYYFISELKISPQYDSFFMKLRIMLSYIFVMLVSNLIMPIHSYRSMLRTEFLTITLAFMSYTMTYPCAYFIVLHLFYEIIIIQMMFRYFMQRNARPLQDAFVEMINNEDNLNDLADINQEYLMRDLNQPLPRNFQRQQQDHQHRPREQFQEPAPRQEDEAMDNYSDNLDLRSGSSSSQSIIESEDIQGLQELLLRNQQQIFNDNIQANNQVQNDQRIINEVVNEVVNEVILVNQAE